MDDTAILSYVVASAKLLGLTLDAAQAARVAAHLGRTAGMAALLDGVKMAPEDEIAEIYRPAAFQPADFMRGQL
jgi:hypothetical protein